MTTNTLPIHLIPPHRMSKLTNKARNAGIKARLQRWVDSQIMDDPRPIEEQMRDEASPDRSPVMFSVVVLLCVAFYVGLYLFLTK